jgi:hypothetical protein
MAHPKQISELIPQPWRSDLIDAARRKDSADIDAVRAELIRRFPKQFKAEPVEGGRHV